MYREPSYPHFALRPMAGSLGAEIHGIDLRTELSPETRADIARAFASYHLLCIRDQRIDLDDYRRFARLFGSHSGDRLHLTVPGHPEFVRVEKKAGDRSPTFGGHWHTDLSFFERPPRATLLYAEELPPYGGDTLYANLHLAWQALSPTLRSMIEDKIAIHSGHGTYARNSGYASVKVVADDWADSEAEQEHPLVPQHPTTGRQFLFLNRNVVRIKGMTEDESAPLLNYLRTVTIDPRFTCRLSWSVGTLAVWDNRCLLHCAIGDYPEFRRVMCRTTIAGEPLFPAVATRAAA